MAANSGYILVFHGSRDPRHHEGIVKLTKLVKDGLSQTTLVESACLELAPLPLCEQIYQWGLEAGHLGLKQLKIIPLLLLTGVHLQEDIPKAIRQAQKLLGANPNLQMLPHLGSYVDLPSWLQKQYQSLPIENKILLAHGSRLENANQEIRNLAAQIGASIAYWSLEPQLSQKVADLVNKGTNSLGIIPYFLFEGKITEAIALQVEELQAQYPHTSLHLAKPLGASSALAQLIIKELSHESNL